MTDASFHDDLTDADAQAIDRRLAESLNRLPTADLSADMHGRVLGRVARRRTIQRLGALAAAAAIVGFGWRLWPDAPSGRPGPDVPNRVALKDSEAPGEESSPRALAAQWDQLLDEATSVPTPVMELSVLRAQGAWFAALEQVQR